MWKNIVEQGRPQMTIWRMRIACWTTKATNTHSDYVILIAFPLQQWLHERASLLLHMNYMSCFSWLQCPALTGHRLKYFGFLWLDPTDIARFSIKVALTMAWRTSHFFVRPWNVFGGQHIEPQNEPGVRGKEDCPSCSTRKFKAKYINQLHVNVMVLNCRHHHHPSSKLQSL
jgi:hypothetical protein